MAAASALGRAVKGGVGTAIFAELTKNLGAAVENKASLWPNRASLRRRPIVCSFDGAHDPELANDNNESFGPESLRLSSLKKRRATAFEQDQVRRPDRTVGLSS